MIAIVSIRLALGKQITNIFGKSLVWSDNNDINLLLQHTAVLRLFANCKQAMKPSNLILPYSVNSE